jgi:hypothetical protein
MPATVKVTPLPEGRLGIATLMFRAWLILLGHTAPPVSPAQVITSELILVGMLSVNSALATGLGPVLVTRML